MIYFRNKSNQNRKILKWLKSKSKSLKNDLNRDLNHIRFKSPMILTTLTIGLYLYGTNARFLTCRDIMTCFINFLNSSVGGYGFKVGLTAL
jgi:hypothetical protein